MQVEVIDIELLKKTILFKVEGLHQPTDDAIKKVIEDEIHELVKTKYLPIQQRINIVTTLFNALRRFDILQPMIDDESITEIMVHGCDPIHIEKGGKIYQLDQYFKDSYTLENVIQKMVGAVNRTVNERHPICDARLENGSRIHVVLPPVAINGPILTIRKFPKDPYTFESLVHNRSLTQEAAKYLEKLVKAKYNIFICGGTGSGKTTFLNVLAQTIPKDERLITLEDSAELNLSQHENLVRLETRMPNSSGQGEIAMDALIKAALRMRPDRIIVGEVRGKEALDMLQAMNTGHDGSLSTGHGNSSKDMLLRLETMVLMAQSIPTKAIRQQIVSAIDIIIFLGRLRDGRRCVLEILEVLALDGEEIGLQELFKFEYQEGAEHVGVLKKTKEKLMAQNKLIEAGFEAMI